MTDAVVEPGRQGAQPARSRVGVVTGRRRLEPATRSAHDHQGQATGQRHPEDCRAGSEVTQMGTLPGLTEPTSNTGSAAR